MEEMDIRWSLLEFDKTQADSTRDNKASSGNTIVVPKTRKGVPEPAEDPSCAMRWRPTLAIVSLGYRCALMEHHLPGLAFAPPDRTSYRVRVCVEVRR